MIFRHFYFVFCFFAFVYCASDNSSVDISSKNINNEHTQEYSQEKQTKVDYGKMLYENPRGIKCIKCHGVYGEGKIISFYKHKGVRKKLVAPRINNIALAKFKKKLFFKSNSIMPSYFFTNDEIRHIYKYLTQAYQNNKGTSKN